MDVATIQFVRARDAIKMSRILLHSICISTSVSSFLLWVIPPFASQNQTIRVGSLLLGMGLSTTGLVSAYKLKHHQSLYEALDLAEKVAFNNYLARETYIPQLGYTEDNPAYFSEYNATDDKEVLQPEVLPDETSTTTSEQISTSLILEVGREVSNGSSDTFIIENVLQCKGRKYQDGKAKLAEIKELMTLIESGGKTANN